MNAPSLRAPLVAAEIIARMGAQKLQNLFDRGLALRGSGIDIDRSSGGVAVVDVGKHRLRHFFRGKDVIGHARVDRASRHAVEFRGLGGLHQAHAAFGSDLLQSLGAVASGSGEHDRDRPFAMLDGNRAEEHVDRMTLATRYGRLGHAQFAAMHA